MPQIDILCVERLPKELFHLIQSAPMPGLDSKPRCSVTAGALPAVVSALNLAGTTAESALWLLAGELDRSHEISQSIGSADGSFWHGVMHRREGDFWNAKYWFRKVGKSVVLSNLADQISNEREFFEPNRLPIASLTESASIAESLVDLVERSLSGQSKWQPDLQLICWWEWQLLFRHCSQLG